MLLRVGFSLCLQALVHWYGFHAARIDSEWCILIHRDVLLLKQLLPDICQAAGDFCFQAHHTCERALSCCTNSDFTPDIWSPNRQDISSVDYRLLTVIQECVFSETAREGSSNIVDELWLLTEGYFINVITLHFIR